MSSLEQNVEVFYLPWDAPGVRDRAHLKMECERVCNDYKSSPAAMADLMNGYRSFRQPSTQRFTFDVIKSQLRKPWMVPGDMVNAVRGFLGQAIPSLPESPEIIEAAAGATAALCALFPSRLEECFQMLKAGTPLFQIFAHQKFFKFLASPTPGLLQETKQARASMLGAGVVGQTVELFVQGANAELPALQNASVCGLGYLGLFVGTEFMQDGQFQGLLSQWVQNPHVAEGFVRIFDALVCGGNLESYGHVPLAQYLGLADAGVWDAVAQLLIDAEALAYCQSRGMIPDIVQVALRMLGECSSLKVVKKLRTVLSMSVKFLMDTNPSIVVAVCTGCVEKISSLFSQNVVFGNENAVRIAREAARVVETVSAIDQSAGADLLVKLCLEGRDLTRDKGHLMSLLIITDELLHENREDCLVHGGLLPRLLTFPIWPSVREILNGLAHPGDLSPVPEDPRKYGVPWPPIGELLDRARNPVNPGTYYQNYFLLRVACRILYYLWESEPSETFDPKQARSCLWSCYASLIVLSEPVQEGQYSPMAQEFLEILKNVSEWLPFCEWFQILPEEGIRHMQELCNNLICAGDSKRDETYHVVGVLADDDSVGQVFQLLQTKFSLAISPADQVVVARHVLSFLGPVVKIGRRCLLDSVNPWECVRGIWQLLGHDKQLMALAVNLISDVGQQIQHFWDQQDPIVLCAVFKAVSRLLGYAQGRWMIDFVRKMIPMLKQVTSYMATVPLESREYKLVVVPLVENMVLCVTSLTSSGIAELPANVLLDLVSHMLRLMYRRPELSAKVLAIVTHVSPQLARSVDIWGPAFGGLLKRSFDPLSYGTLCILLRIRDLSKHLSSPDIPDAYRNSLGLYGGQAAVELVNQMDFENRFVAQMTEELENRQAADDLSVLRLKIIQVIAAKNQCLFQ